MPEPEAGLFSWRNPWFRWSVSGVAAVAVLSALAGFVWLPSTQADFSARGLWESICRAAGVPAEWGSADSAGSKARRAARGATEVVLTAEMASVGGTAALGRGATIAVQQCSMCHGAQGVSEANNAPNLAGQYPEVVIKQLHDYKRGVRASGIMQTLAERLSERDIEDLAAYYDSLPKARTAPVRSDETNPPALVRVGDPMRNIAPCISCHGGIDHKLGTPWLEGMPRMYLAEQLRNFASGARRNDSHAQMRNMARAMTPAEIEQVATFYARRPSAGHAAER